VGQCGAFLHPETLRATSEGAEEREESRTEQTWRKMKEVLFKDSLSLSLSLSLSVSSVSLSPLSQGYINFYKQM
jgi:hypothetical protein